MNRRGFIVRLLGLVSVFLAGLFGFKKARNLRFMAEFRCATKPARPEYMVPIFHVRDLR